METWQPIKNYEGLYEVSDLGNVKNVARKIILPTGGELFLKEKILRQRKNRGYCIVNLCKNSKKFSAKVHRLVAIHFIDNPENKHQVDHLFSKEDNRAASLVWATGSENMRRSFKVGTHVSPACKGEKNGRSKLTRFQIWEIRKKYAQSSTRKLAAEYGVSNILISKIVNFKIWNYGLS